MHKMATVSILVFVAFVLGVSSKTTVPAPTAPHAVTGPQCDPLPAPTNGVVQCTHNDTHRVCNAICTSGFVFKNGVTSSRKICDVSGQWINGTQFPDCVATSCDTDVLKTLPDSQFSASSVWTGVTGEYFGAERSRIDAVARGNGFVTFSGGWRPASNELDQYVQIDLIRTTRITGISTKGRDVSAGDTADEFVTRFRVLHSMDGHMWQPYSSATVIDVFFTGNTDHTTPMTNQFSCPFNARYVRVNPISWHENIALRFSLLGCQSDGSTPACLRQETTTLAIPTPPPSPSSSPSSSISTRSSPRTPTNPVPAVTTTTGTQRNLTTNQPPTTTTMSITTTSPTTTTTPTTTTAPTTTTTPTTTTKPTTTTSPTTTTAPTTTTVPITTTTPTTTTTPPTTTTRRNTTTTSTTTTTPAQTTHSENLTTTAVKTTRHGTMPTAMTSLCDIPPPITQGLLDCEQQFGTSNILVCVGHCQLNYVFETNKIVVKHVCDQRTGVWSPGIKFPACIENVHSTPLPIVHNYTHGCVTTQIDCGTFGNGDFHSCGGCHFFASCSEGFLYTRACPEHLVFDAESSVCDYRSSTCALNVKLVG